MGKSAVARLKVLMNAKKIKFRPWKIFSSGL
jgi:hypothetical protein